ncbi:unnamed protein product [Urochloa humidicola]
MFLSRASASSVPAAGRLRLRGYGARAAVRAGATDAGGLRAAGAAGGNFNGAMMNPPQVVSPHTQSRGDKTFWEGCCAALCCCCILDMCC